MKRLLKFVILAGIAGAFAAWWVQRRKPSDLGYDLSETVAPGDEDRDEVAAAGTPLSDLDALEDKVPSPSAVTAEGEGRPSPLSEPPARPFQDEAPPEPDEARRQIFEPESTGLSESATTSFEPSPWSGISPEPAPWSGRPPEPSDQPKLASAQPETLRPVEEDRTPGPSAIEPPEASPDDATPSPLHELLPLAADESTDVLPEEAEPPSSAAGRGDDPLGAMLDELKREEDEMAQEEEWLKSTLARARDEGSEWTNPAAASDYLEEGNSLFRSGEFRLAEERYSLAIGIAPEQPLAYYNRGNARARLGNFDAALSDFDRAIDLAPDDSDALNNRGMLRLQRGEIDLALQDFETALDRRPNDPALMVNRGLASLRLSRFNAARQDFERALSIDQRDAAARYGAAQATAQLGDVEQSLVHLREALRLDPWYRLEVESDGLLSPLRGLAGFLSLTAGDAGTAAG